MKAERDANGIYDLILNIWEESDGTLSQTTHIDR
jgi:hypothetical protein